MGGADRHLVAARLAREVGEVARVDAVALGHVRVARAQVPQLHLDRLHAVVAERPSHRGHHPGVEDGQRALLDLGVEVDVGAGLARLDVPGLEADGLLLALAGGLSEHLQVDRVVAGQGLVEPDGVAPDAGLGRPRQAEVGQPVLVGGEGVLLAGGAEHLEGLDVPLVVGGDRDPEVVPQVLFHHKVPGDDVVHVGHPLVSVAGHHPGAAGIARDAGEGVGEVRHVLGPVVAAVRDHEGAAQASQLPQPAAALPVGGGEGDGVDGEPAPADDVDVLLGDGLRPGGLCGQHERPFDKALTLTVGCGPHDLEGCLESAVKAGVGLVGEGPPGDPAVQPLPVIGRDGGGREGDGGRGAVGDDGEVGTGGQAGDELKEGLLQRLPVQVRHVLRDRS